jgi:hypothetical protein
MDLESTAYCLGVDRSRVIAAVEDGRLAWAWDFSVPPARRRELRIWRGCVAEWLRTSGDNGGKDFDLETVLSDILPHRDCFSSELKRILVLHRTTIQKLLDHKLLSGTWRAPMDGVLNNAVRIPRSSIVSLMSKRRIGMI